MHYPKENSPKKYRYYLCVCPYCKKEFKTQARAVKSGKTKKCLSCSKKIKDFSRHGTHKLRKHPLYSVWSGIKSRCNNKNEISFKNYGGRGIKICDDWKDNFKSFYDWSIANGYNQGLTIDRINNDGNYEPSNCRWTDRNTQARNTRRLAKNNSTGFRGVFYHKINKKWTSSICVNYNHIYLGSYSCRLKAAYAYDEYVIKNNLEHTRNFM